MAVVPSPLAPSTPVHDLLFNSRHHHGPWPCCSQISSQKLRNVPLFPITVKVKCLAKSTEEDRFSEPEAVDGDGVRKDVKQPQRIGTSCFSSDDSISLSPAIRETVYEVVEVKSNGIVSTRKINRHQLLKSSGLRPRDIRRVDPSLFLTNSMPSLLAIEAALLSPVLHLEQRLMLLEPHVRSLLEVLPNRTADILEKLRISKQTLVELSSRAGALRQVLLDLLKDPHEIRRICIMGRNCTPRKGNDDVKCSVPSEKQIAEEEEEEMEMLLENYLQRCESCHGHSDRLLDSTKDMEDSVAVNLRTVPVTLSLQDFCEDFEDSGSPQLQSRKFIESWVEYGSSWP